MVGGKEGGSSNMMTFLSAVGLAFVIFTTICLCKLVVALSIRTNFEAALLSALPDDAYDGKVFWITGASSGIGRALALHLSSSHNNVKLILSSRRRDILEEVADQCQQISKGVVEAKVLPLDLADHSTLPSIAEEALSMYGYVDVLVNNGGVTTRSMARNAEFGVDTYVNNIDFLSYVALTKSLLPSWEKNKHSKPIIINTSSVAGKIGVPVRTAYSSAKFAIQGWFDAFRIEQELAGYPVDVLNVVLGSTRTNVARNAITNSADVKFGETDDNIEAGLDSEFVVERVLASAYANQKELWIAPRKELLMLYLNQYMPNTANKLLTKKVAKQYAVEKRVNEKHYGEL